MKLLNLRDVRLNKDNAPLRVNPGCEPVKHHIIDILLKAIRALKRGQGVDIHYGVDALVLIL